VPTPVSHVWKPGTARVVAIDSFIPVPRGAAVIAPPPLNWPTKDPADILDYKVDITPAVAGNDGDLISTLDVTSTPNDPGDIVIQSATADGTIAVIWISGGQAGTVYTVTVLVTTASGRTLQRSVLLPVLPLSALPVPANAIQVSSGIVLTDQNGNPVLAS
jgi:hypothetical protein